MENPILQTLGQTAHQTQPTDQLSQISSMISQVRNSSDPDSAMQNLVQSNPNMQGVMNYIQQNGGDAKTAFYNLASQKGINPNSILNLLRSLK